MHSTLATTEHFIRSTTLLVFFLLMGMPVYADESPDARILIQEGRKNTAFQGEKLSFYIKLLSPTWFSGSPRFDLPEVQNGLLYQVQGRPTLGSEHITGQDYTSQLHEFWFFSKIAGEITVPEISVTFSTAVPGGGEPLHHQLQTSPFVVRVQPVPGAAGSTQIIATNRFDVQQSWEPKPEDSHTGSATTRIIRMRAADMASIFLPEISYPPTEGIAIYRKPASVNDFNERGEATAERQESTTYLFEKEGTYTLPDIKLSWWNSDVQQMEEITLPGAVVKISPGPLTTQSKTTTPHPEKEFHSVPIILAFLAGAGILFAAAFRFGPALINRIHERKQRYRHSEPAFFKMFKDSCRTGDIAAAYNHLFFWIRKKSGRRLLTIDHFLEEHQQPQLNHEVEVVRKQLFAPPQEEPLKWQGAGLYSQVVRARKNTAPPGQTEKAKQTYQELNF